MIASSALPVVRPPNPPCLWTFEDGYVTLWPHFGQQRAWESKRRFIFMLAGSQSGKTTFGPHWLWREINDKGPGDYLAVTSTFPLLKLKMLPEFLTLFQNTLHLGRWRAGDKVFEFHDGKTRVIFGSAIHSGGLESATAKAAWCDEIGMDDFRLESWEAILRRLSLYRGRVLAGTTIYNLGWLKQQVYDPWERGNPDYDVIQFDSTANPLFPHEEFRRAEATMPAWKFQMFYRGRYAHPAGLIYNDYQDDYREHGGQKVHAFPIPPEWPVWGAFDFGGVNTARLMIAQDPEVNVYYVFDELLSGDKTTAQHAQEALAFVVGRNMQTWHGGAPAEKQIRRDFNQEGVMINEPPFAEVEPGLDRVISLFKQRRLYVFDTCAGLRSELGTYARILDEAGNATDQIRDKATYHRADSLRYLVSGIVTSDPTQNILDWIKMTIANAEATKAADATNGNHREPLPEAS